MANKGRKPGNGVGEDKLADALRRAEEAVLRDGKLKDEEAKKDKEPKSRPPVELDDSHFSKKEPEKKPEKKASKGLDLDSVLFGDKPKKKPAAKPAEPPKQKSPPPMVDLSKKEEPAPKKPAAPAKKEPDRPPPNLGFGELDLGGGSTDSPELELSAMSEDPVESPAAPTPAPPAPKAQVPLAQAPVEKLPETKPPPMRDPSREYVPYVPKRSYGRQIKIFLLVVLILAAIGGGVYGFIKWRQSVAAAEAAEKAKIENSSLDSLRDDTFKKEKFK